jgi:DNA invertase Pin-like site-specific DNA recombinase
METKAAIYSRKSRFTGKGESIENQVELCRQYIGENFGGYMRDNALVYEDEGFSGGNLERPQFKKMMADARAGKFSMIVVYRLDRISRNISDFAQLIGELGDRKVAFVSIREQFDTTSPMGRAMMYIASIFSQLERETIAERIRDNMQELSKTGRWLGGVTPTGYCSEAVERVTVDGKTRKACKLKLIPEEAQIVGTIFEKFIETGSLTRTDEYLQSGAYKTKNGKQYTRFAIKGILMNPVYMIADHDAYRYLTEKKTDLFSEETEFDGVHGIMAYNRTIQKPGKANQLRPVNEWIIAVGKHQGIISGEMWIQAQGLLERNRSHSYRQPRSNVALLSGLLYCGNCGSHMRPKLTKRTNENGELLYSYVCTEKEHSHGQNCAVKNVNGNVLDQAVLNEVKKISADSGEFVRRLERSRKEIAGKKGIYEKELERFQQALETENKLIKGLVASLSKAAGTAAEEYIVQQIDELHGKSEALKERISELEKLVGGNGLSNIEMDAFRQMLSSFQNTIDGMSIMQKRAAVQMCVRQVVWDGKNLFIYLYGSDDQYDFSHGDQQES